MKLINLFILILVYAFNLNAQDKLPTIKSNVNVISIQDGKNFGKDAWTLAVRIS